MAAAAAAAALVSAVAVAVEVSLTSAVDFVGEGGISGSLTNRNNP